MDARTKATIESLLRLGREYVNNGLFAEKLTEKKSVIQLLLTWSLEPQLESPLKRLLAEVDAHAKGDVTSDQVRESFLQFQDAWQLVATSRFPAFTFPFIQALVSLAVSLSAMLVGSQGLLTFLGIHAAGSATQAPSTARAQSPPTDLHEDLTLYVLQVFFLIVLAILFQTSFLPVAKRQVEDLGDARVRATFLQFRNGWTAIYVLWIVLYTWWAVAALARVPLPYAGAIGDVINALSSIAFAYTFAVLDMPSVHGDASRSTSEFRRFLAVMIGLGTVLGALSFADRFNWPVKFGGIAVGANGLFGAVAMTYFIGRLDSHVLGLSRGLLGLMYVYAVIQPLYPLLQGDNPNIRIALLCLAMGLKIAFFFIVGYYLVNSGQLVRYLHDRKPGGSDDSAPPPSRRGVLPRAFVRDIHAAAIAVGLKDHRAELLAGVDKRLASSLPESRDSGGQLFSDLFALNETQAGDGSIPLLQWLENAQALRASHRASSVFAKAIIMIRENRSKE